MSAIAYYHFAFMSICLALFGLTVGAIIVHFFTKTMFQNYADMLRLLTLIFAAELIVHLYCITELRVFFFSEEGLVPIKKNLVLIFSSIVIPFIACGACLSLVFERYVRAANKIYFINLVGAALGCLLFIPTINFLGVINTYLVMIFVLMVAAHLFEREKVNIKYLAILFVLIISIIAANQRMDFLDLKWIKGFPTANFFYKKWNSYSFVRMIYGSKHGSPVGWSFAPNKLPELRATQIEQIHLDIDGGAGTSMNNFEKRDLSTVQFLRYDLTSLPYYLVKNGDVLVIGIGAGRDILTGLLFNQHSITGVEINKTIIDIHRTVLRKFNGDLSRHPKVKFVNNEARSYINASDKKFDIVQISLIDTFAATQAGAYALSENNLYTTEAIKTYWDHLKDDGMISISYWTIPYMLKIMGSATYALSESGIKNPRAHFILVHSDNPARTQGVANILIKKTPFTQNEIDIVKKYCDEMGFHFALSPQWSYSEEFAKVSDIRLIDKFVKASKENITPATDDNPFFFITTRLNFSNTLRNFKLFEVKKPEEILLSLFVLMLVLSLLFVIIPLVGLAVHQSFKDVPVFSFGTYFISIGLAFMFVEMTQMTRLSSFLGHPSYSLAVALFTFLLGSGIGSLFLGRTDGQKAIQTYLCLFLSLCVLSASCTAPLLHFSSKFPIEARIAIAVVFLFPIAFFMGMFLPQGMKLLNRKKAPVALFWGLNGAASVLGSILAMILQIKLGLSMAFCIGVGLYALAAILLLYLERRCFNKKLA